MELRVLRYFLAVAREENITKAAALLHLTQPTLSRQLMQLEEELGVQLFHRSRYHIVLTDEGMLLRRRAQELVDLAEKTAREFRKDPELRGEISIGSGVSGLLSGPPPAGDVSDLQRKRRRHQGADRRGYAGLRPAAGAGGYQQV